MGCGASHGVSQFIPDFDQIKTKSPLQPASASFGHRLTGSARPGTPVPDSITQRHGSLAGPMVPTTSGDDDSRIEFSSWNSAHWRNCHVEGVPMPPDRRLHDRHLAMLNTFRGTKLCLIMPLHSSVRVGLDRYRDD